MELIRKLSEDADGGAVAAGDVCSSAMPLFAQFVKRDKAGSKPAPKPIVIKYGKLATKTAQKKGPFTSLGLKEAVRPFYENNMQSMDSTIDPDFDSSSVTAKLKALEQRDKEDYQNTTTFGLEDDDGQVVRVRVKSEQAQEFEKALQSFMMDSEEDEELPEIAELLFKLKDQFDIVDVEWPEIAEDEEEGQVLDGEEVPAGDDAGLGTDLDAGGDMGGDLGGDVGAPAEPAVTDLLTQVIDMMKADAEARKADARAREAEAKNREAEAAIAQAQTRVKQEEQLLDMDTYNKNKKEQEKEAKRLAQLAQWKREVDNDAEPEDDGDFGLGQSIRGGEENEEVHGRRPSPVRPQSGRKTLGGRVHPHEVAKFILNRMR